MKGKNGMTEQERKKAFENQRRNAERRAKEADGTYDMEASHTYEKKQREERRLQQQRQALKAADYSSSDCSCCFEL